MNDAQDFQDLETASSSGSFHVLSHPLGFWAKALPRFSVGSLTYGTFAACQEPFL